MNKLTLSIVAIYSAIIAGSVNAEYKFIDLHSSSLPSGSSALAINNLNQAVGFQSERISINNYPSTNIPVLWDIATGLTSDLATPKDRVTGYAADINEHGQILVHNYSQVSSSSVTTLVNGDSSTILNGDKSHFLFLLSHHKDLELNNDGQSLASGQSSTIWGPIGVPLNLNKSVNGINDNGQMVGSIIINGAKHAALFENADTIDLGIRFPWAVSSNAFDINNSGQIIATAYGATTGYRSFLVDGDIVRSLKSTGDKSEAIAINEHGIVVGYQAVKESSNSPYYTERQSEAVIWDGHNQYKLNDFLDQDSKDAGWVLVTANDINDNGWVVGEAFNRLTFERHAYALSTDEMLSPIPEPSTYLMLLAGLGLLGFMARKKQL